MRKIVFSTTLTQVGWNSELFKEISSKKSISSRPGKDISVGGASLAGSFIRLGLVDEYRLYVHPVILGSGKLMFPTWSIGLT
jgi:dihydrofolate reductase